MIGIFVFSSIVRPSRCALVTVVQSSALPIFTLPVMLLMLSNHYSFTFTSSWSWVVMSLFIFAGALIRQYFVLRHMGKNQPVYPLTGVFLLLLALWLAAPAPVPSTVSASSNGQRTAASIQAASAGGLSRVQAIVKARCVQCHSATPVQAGFTAPPAGMALDTQDQILLHAAQIKQVVASAYMPLGNITKMTDEERAVIAGWSGLQ